MLDSIAGGEQSGHVVGEMASGVLPAKPHGLDVGPWDPVVSDGGRAARNGFDRVVAVVDTGDDVPLADSRSVISGVAGDDDAFAGDGLAVHGIGSFRVGVVAGVFRCRVTSTTRGRSLRFAQESESNGWLRKRSPRRKSMAS